MILSSSPSTILVFCVWSQKTQNGGPEAEIRKMLILCGLDRKKKTISFRGQRAGVQFAQEYAMALHKLGQTDAALKVIEEHL